MNHTIRDLLTNLIDYAGLFPPALLDMKLAVRNYAAYREGENRRWLGRFVVPVARLDEFESAAGGILPDGGWEGNEFWRLSALGGPDLSSDLNRVAEFNRRYATLDSNAGVAIIDTIETKAGRASDIRDAVKLLPESLTAYIEIPITDDPTDLIKTIADIGQRAKVRTGGVTPDAFPSSFNLARFIKACADEDVPFKATAGLHHPLRSVNKLTYEPGSGMALMHGFLNVFLAAAFAHSGMSVEQLTELLEERSPEAFQFDSGGVTWRDEMVVRGQLRNSRSLFAIAFGSCSFEEPIEDMKKIGLL